LKKNKKLKTRVSTCTKQITYARHSYGDHNPIYRVQYRSYYRSRLKERKSGSQIIEDSESRKEEERVFLRVARRGMVLEI